MSAKKLSVNQEIRLLRSLKNAEILGNGSSRIVFVDPRDSNRIVKLAIGACSFFQNRNEVRFWQRTEANQLAKIYEFGRFCVVMERAQFVVLDDEDYQYNLDDEARDDAEQIVYWLEENLGTTADNYQVGMMKDGRWASFDYGFLPGVHALNQCGWADYIRDNLNEIRQYIDKCVDILQRKRPITEIERQYKGVADF